MGTSSATWSCRQAWGPIVRPPRTPASAGRRLPSSPRPSPRNGGLTPRSPQGPAPAPLPNPPQWAKLKLGGSLTLGKRRRQRQTAWIRGVNPSRREFCNNAHGPDQSYTEVRTLSADRAFGVQKLSFRNKLQHHTRGIGWRNPERVLHVVNRDTARDHRSPRRRNVLNRDTQPCECGWRRTGHRRA